MKSRPGLQETTGMEKKREKKKKKKRKKKVPFCVFQSFPLGLEVFVDVKSDYHGVRSVRFTLS